MTKNRFTKIAMLAAASLALVATTAKSQVVYNNANGDFLLGFRQTGTSNDIIVDIGSFNLNTTTPITFTLGDLGTKLGNTFGANWATDGTVFFSVAGTTVPGDAANTSYVTRAEFTGQGEPTPWNNLSTGNAIALKNKIIAQGTAYNSISQTSGNPASVQSTSATNSYASYHPGGVNDAGHAQGNISYGFFNPTTEGNFSGGTAGVSLDVYRILASTGAAVDIGDFTLSADGNTLTFTPDILEVPEPSTYALLFGACALAVLVHCRRLRSRLH
jgi:hypothetical protein